MGNCRKMPVFVGPSTQTISQCLSRTSLFTVFGKGSSHKVLFLILFRFLLALHGTECNILNTTYLILTMITILTILTIPTVFTYNTDDTLKCSQCLQYLHLLTICQLITFTMLTILTILNCRYYLTYIHYYAIRCRCNIQKKFQYSKILH